MPVTPFSILAKPTGAICNLDCHYCYYLSKEKLYPGSRFRMSDDVLEEYLRQLLDTESDVTVAWQGGEPMMMGLDFFKRSIEIVEKHRRRGQRVAHTLQTNSTLVGDEWAAFLSEHGFLVGVSIDGPRDLHDAYRKDRRGEGSFDRVIAGYEMLRRHGVEMNILCTVHTTNQGYPLEVYRFFRDELDARFIQFIPIVESPVTDRSVDAARFGAFLTTIFDEWFYHDIGDVYVQHFDVALAAWHGVPGGLCIFAETCGDALALEHNGDLYSCDHFVEPDHLLGNITATPMSDLARSENQHLFGQAKAELPEYCRSCDVRFACNGGCPKNRFIRTPDGEEGLNYLCAGYKAFFAHVDGPMRLMSDLLNRGLPPAQAPGLLAMD